MNIYDIEAWFKDESKLEEVLKYCLPDFESIDNISKVLKTSKAGDPNVAENNLDVLTGIFMNLEVVLGIAQYYELDLECRRSDKLRIDAEAKGEKLTSASADKQAQVYVSSYRRVRKIIEAYRNACDKAITSTQSKLKQIISEMNKSIGR